MGGIDQGKIMAGKNARIRNATYVENYKRKNPCKKCGERRPVLLTFHHKDPKTKKYTVASLISKGRPIETLIEEINKCDVLCCNCHALEHCDTIKYRATKLISFCGLKMFVPGTLSKLKYNYG